MRTELYYVDGPWPGRLAIMPRPRGGDWLDDEIRTWRAVGVDKVVSLLTADETDELDLDTEADACAAAGVEYMSFRVNDRSVPPAPPAFDVLVRRLYADLAAGRKVAVHCRAGVGRSAVLVASLLAAGGIDPDAAFERIAAARGRPVPDTDEQREWVCRFAKRLLPAPAA